MGDAELVEIWIRATPTSWESETEGVPGPFPGQILKRWKEMGGQAAQHKGANLPGPVALPDRLVSRIGRSLEDEGTRMAARKARDRGR